MQRWWFGAAAWTILSCSDYYLTVWGARLYAQRAKAFLEIEGSYESIPLLAADVDAFRLISPRMFLVVVLGGLTIALLRLLHGAWGIDDETFLLVLGALLLVEAPIHLRHIGNIARFRWMTADSGIQGRIRYPRSFILRASPVDFMAFAILLLLGFAASSSWFLLGGAVRCFALSAYFLFISRKAGAPHP